MKLSEAKLLHSGDEVVVKADKETNTPSWIGRVVEVEIEHRTNRESVSIMLDDGNWYGHTEIK